MALMLKMREEENNKAQTQPVAKLKQLFPSFFNFRCKPYVFIYIYREKNSYIIKWPSFTAKNRRILFRRRKKFIGSATGMQTYFFVYFSKKSTICAFVQSHKIFLRFCSATHFGWSTIIIFYLRHICEAVAVAGSWCCCCSCCSTA